jgi:hypothetical protein
MNTATAINYEALTTTECKDAIDRILNSNMTSSDKWLISNEDIRLATYGIINNLQLRDYLLGAPYSHSLSRSIEGIKEIIERCDHLGIETYQLQTILASLYYERGDTADALLMVSAGLQNNYSLARLLSRVIVSGWDRKALATMRKELHPKVVEELVNTGDLLANEDNR